MEKAKMLQLVMAVIITAVIAGGCSEDSMSPVSSISTSGNASENKPARPEVFSVKLQPFETVFIDHKNTGYYRINSFAMKDCALTESLIRVTGFDRNCIFPLDCNNEGISILGIEIENRSKEIINIEFTITGTKYQIKDPVKISYE